MHTINQIEIAAPPEVVFRLAAAIERWPEMLAHYRYVRVSDAPAEDGPPGVTRRAIMAARRGPIPVRWTSIQVVEPGSCRVLYRHVGGVTRGMAVEWRLRPAAAGCAVEIVHDLYEPRGLLRMRFAGWVAARVFVTPIADATLRGIKRAAEAGALEGER